MAFGEAMLEWTGERYVPWADAPLTAYEHLHRYRFAREFVKGKNVLDLACGEGYGSFMFSEDAHCVIGIDIDDATVRHASAKYLRENLKFIKGSITEVPIEEEGMFDIIVCFEALEHITEHNELIKEVKRLLKKDGTFIVSTPNKSEYSEEQGYKNPFHIKEFYLDEFKDILENNFKNILLYGQKMYPSSNIFPLGKSSMIANGFAIERDDKEFHFLPLEGKRARYFIAVTSDGNLDSDDIGESYLVDISETLIRQQDTHITNLDTHITNLENMIRDKDVRIACLKQKMEHSSKLIQKVHRTLLALQKIGKDGL